MPPPCAVNGCNNFASKSTKEQGITFHRFPMRNEIAYLKWIELLRVNRNEPSWNPKEYTVVCSTHFKNEDLYNTGKGYRCVVRNGYPKLLETPKMQELNFSPATSNGIEVETPLKVETVAIADETNQPTSESAGSNQMRSNQNQMSLPDPSIPLFQYPQIYTTCKNTTETNATAENSKSEIEPSESKTEEFITCRKCGHRNEHPGSLRTDKILSNEPSSTVKCVTGQKELLLDIARYSTEDMLNRKNKFINRQKKKIKNLNQTIRRLQNRNKSLKTLLISIQERKIRIATKN